MPEVPDVPKVRVPRVRVPEVLGMREVRDVQRLGTSTSTLGTPGTLGTLGTLASLLATARDEYAAALRRGDQARQIMANYSDSVDALIRSVASSAADEPRARHVVCALGGYGRRTLCLHSDIDLLIVFDGRIRAAEEQIVKALLHPLWDLRLTVGHQVRELAELDFFDQDNPEFLLALLDLRWLAGNPSVFDGVRERSEGAGKERWHHATEILRSLIARRHRTFNETLYQLEPDIKEAPGGLRDAVAAQWFRDLAAHDWPRSEQNDVTPSREAEDFLLGVRSILHLETGRNTNVLTHRMQERVSEMRDYAGASVQHRVEAFMSDYFRHARSIAQTLQWWQNGGRMGKPAAVTDVPPADGEWQPEAILDLLRPRRGFYQRLTRMRDCGLLGKIFPEFQKIHCRVIRDFHHRYTVDEHTLLTLRNVESLLDPATASRDRFGSLLRELHAPELLALALLYHDVGKWKDDDHASESVRMARPMLDRLALPADARHVVEFLIGNHLQMSRIAFRRDSEDPDVVRDFAAIVGTEERLKMLCLLTLADIEAVSPDALTPWKEELLWRLYVDTYNCLTMSYADDLIDNDPAIAVTLSVPRPDDIGADELSQFLGGLPKRYLALFNAEQIYRHVRLARDIHRDEVHSFLESKDDIWELTVVTLDKPYLFASISGVLSYFGMDILRAQAMTTPACDSAQAVPSGSRGTQGLVLDVFQFVDADAFLRHNPGAAAEICQRLDEVVAGRVDVERLLRAKEHSVLYRRGLVAPVVHFDHEHSKKYTVLEIVADDAPGLLHRISRVISSQGCGVDLALISTEGRKAIDVLHVTKDRQKLSESDRVALKQALAQALETNS